MYIWWNHSQKTVLVIKTVLKNFKSDQTVLIIVTVLIILSCIIWPMYSTYNSDILKKWETVLIICSDSTYNRKVRVLRDISIQ